MTDATIFDATIFDDRICHLGEGAFWHPTRQELFWVDILGRRLHSRSATGQMSWAFAGYPAAMGWLDHDTLILAEGKALVAFSLATGDSTPLCPLEADDPDTRPNDGRADPFGGFWISTIGTGADKTGKGSIYRFYKGELRKLYSDITTPNSICFERDGEFACFTDTRKKQVMKVRLDGEGWPASAPVLYLDLTDPVYNPDGAVIDALGNFWSAQWGAGRVACYSPEGRFLREVRFPAAQTTCPAFGGPNLDILFCTSAAAGFSQGDLGAAPDQGRTFAVKLDGVKGLAEHQVVL